MCEWKSDFVSSTWLIFYIYLAPFDSVIGLSDGLTVPFALTAGLASLGNSRVVVLGGVAELIAGAISMGIGAFCTFPIRNLNVATLKALLIILVATQAERDSYKFLQQQTAARVAQSCAGELEREVDEILGPIGVPSDLSRQVANTLQREETLALEAEDVSMDVDSQVILESGQPLPQLRFQSTVGLTPFLLQFGLGVEPVPKSRMYSSAATIGVGYLAGGAIPLLPYFFIREYLITL
jgi:vacuolar iron transporter family protein